MPTIIDDFPKLFPYYTTGRGASTLEYHNCTNHRCNADGWLLVLACRALLHWHGRLNDWPYPASHCHCHIIGQVIATGKECITFVLRIHHHFSQKMSLKRGQFLGNFKNNFFSMSKSIPIVCTTYGHVSYAAILYTKPEGLYFHHTKYHRVCSSHSRVEIGA